MGTSGLVTKEGGSLEGNRNGDSIGDLRIAFQVTDTVDSTRCVTDYYVPRIFHLCWTLGKDYYLSISMNELMKSRSVVEVYKNEGILSDSDKIRLIGNWPFRNVKITGLVVSVELFDEDSLCDSRSARYYTLRIDDGSYARENICVQISKYVWSTMEIESSCVGVKTGGTITVYGIMAGLDTTVYIQAERVLYMAESQDGLSEQIKWWEEVLSTRQTLKQPWTLDLTSEQAVLALKLLQKRELELAKYGNQNRVEEDVEIIDLEDDDGREMNVAITANEGKRLVSADAYISQEWSRPVQFSVATPSQLECTVVRVLVKKLLEDKSQKYITMESLYCDYSITVVLNSMVLGGFAESVVGVDSDATIYERWVKTRLQDSKRLLLQCTLERLRFNIDYGPIDTGDEQSAIVLRIPLCQLEPSIDLVEDHFRRENRVPIPVGQVMKRLSCGKPTAIGIVAELIRGGLISEHWVLDSARNSWIYRPLI